MVTDDDVQQILDDGGIDVYTVRLATTALADLKTACRPPR
jgi:hypothetical protein